MLRGLWWVLSDLVAWVYGKLVTAHYTGTINCPDIEKPILLYRAVSLIPSWAGGLTLGRNIFIKASQEKDEYILNSLLAHEITHVRQGQKLGILFPFVYLWESIRRGYRQNSLEVEAYNVGDSYSYGDNVCGDV